MDENSYGDCRDEELLLLFRMGDPKARDELSVRYFRYRKSHLRRACPEYYDVLDDIAFNEVFFRCYLSAERSFQLGNGRFFAFFELILGREVRREAGREQSPRRGAVDEDLVDNLISLGVMLGLEVGLDRLGVAEHDLGIAQGLPHDGAAGLLEPCGDGLFALVDANARLEAAQIHLCVLFAVEVHESRLVAVPVDRADELSAEAADGDGIEVAATGKHINGCDLAVSTGQEQKWRDGFFFIPSVSTLEFRNKRGEVSSIRNRTSPRSSGHFQISN